MVPGGGYAHLAKDSLIIKEEIKIPYLANKH